MLKLKNVFLSLLYMGGVSAYAGSLALDTRFDYDTTTYNKNNNETTSMDNSRIYAQTVRVDGKGNVNDQLSYRLRVNFNKDATVTKKDNMGPNIDFAYITHKWTPELAFTMGRFWSDGYGHQGLVSAIDRYLNPAAVTNWWSLYNNGYVTGGKLEYTFLETHTIEAQLLNQGADQLEGTNYKGQAAGMGFVYKGSILDKSLNFIASHHAWQRAYVTPDLIAKDTLDTIGVKYVMAPLTVMLDYNMGKTKNSNATHDNEIKGFVLNAGYTIDRITPRVFFSSEKETFKDTTGATANVNTDYTRYGVAVEYRPFADTDFRYHVAYTQLSSKADSAGAITLKETHVIAGFKISADFLK